MLLVELENRTI